MKNENDYAIEVVNDMGDLVGQIYITESLEDAKNSIKYFVEEKSARQDEHYRIAEIKYDGIDEYGDKREIGIRVMAEYDRKGNEIY
jgi:hypothetical protein